MTPFLCSTSKTIEVEYPPVPPLCQYHLSPFFRFTINQPNPTSLDSFSLNVLTLVRASSTLLVSNWAMANFDRSSTVEYIPPAPTKAPGDQLDVGFPASS